ncbi:hypothetical protein ACLKA7_012710 [Drosophila subpalustris]
MIRLWILVLTLALLTGSAYGSLTFWMSLLGLGPAQPPPPPPVAAPIILGNYGGDGGCVPSCGGSFGAYGV